MTIPETTAAQEAKNNPSTRSADRSTMDSWIELVTDVLEGGAAIRKKGEKYLPKFEGEGTAEHKRRLVSAPWRPQFEDILRHLCSKPFEEDVSLQGDTVPDQVKELSEDVDGLGNNITQFASEYFTGAVAFGVCLLMVDFPTLNENATVKDERDAGVRPYWIQIHAKDVVSLQMTYVGARAVVTHLRYREVVTVRDGFAEEQVERIRCYDEGSWSVWQQDKKNLKWFVAKDSSGQDMRGEIRRGSRGLRTIPVVPLFTSRRRGALGVKPPLLELADMQIELYRALSRKDEVLTFAGSPILTGNGLKPPSGNAPLKVGPKTVLYAPSGTSGAAASWEYINPNAANIKEIRDDVNDIVEDMRRLGMQPLTQGSGNQTATGHSIEASKANSAVKAWAIRLKDAVEQALVFSCEWMNLETDVEVEVFTDFDVLPFADAPLKALREGRDAGDISRRTYWNGLRRFGVFPQEFRAEDEEKLLAEQARFDAAEAAKLPAPENTDLPAPTE